MATAKELEISTLIYTLKHLTEKYENGEECVHPKTGEHFTDNQYDEMVKRYTVLTGKPYDFKTIGSQPTFIPVTHNPPMTSIDKCNGTDLEKHHILDCFLDECLKATHTTNPAIDFFVMSYKLDGVALSLKYNFGNLVSAGLRTNGTSGEDITNLAQHIPSIPQTINETKPITIRGEVVCMKSDFVSLQKQAKISGEPEPKNARNYVAGALKKSFMDPSEIVARKLTFIAYKLIDPSYNYMRYTDQLLAIKQASHFFRVIGIHNYDYVGLKTMEANASSQDMLIDGIVVTCNYLADCETIGHHSNNNENNPKYNIAYKFKDDVAITDVQSIEWNVGRTGELYPTIHIDPVNLEGTTVSKCTGHNAGYIFSNGIGRGARIEVIKSGKIIPKVHSVITSGLVELPDICPICGLNTKRIYNSGLNLLEHIYCINQNCVGPLKQGIEHFLKTLGVKGIGPAIVSKLVDAELVTNFKDLYTITHMDLRGMSRGLHGNELFTPREAWLILASICMIKENDKVDINKLSNIQLENYVNGYYNGGKRIPIRFYKLLAAFGIDGCGNSVSKLIEQEYPMKNKSIFESSAYLLSQINGIGLSTADNIITYIRTPNKRKMIEFLVSGVFDVQCPQTKANIVLDSNANYLAGKEVCFTGGFTNGKKYWQQKVEQAGGFVKTSFNKSLDYMIIGDKAGVKEHKAKAAGIKTITEKELERMLNGK